MEEHLVVGAGGHAKVVLATLLASGARVRGLVDDDPAKAGAELLGHRVLGRVADAARLAEGASAVVGIGGNATRRALAQRLALRWGRAVHPLAHLAPGARVEEGAAVFAGALVQPDARIGAHAILNTGCSVDHDCRIGAFAHVAPGARLAGEVEVGEGTLVGVGASVIPGVRIGAWAIVGAGAVVVRDVPERAVVAGSPARALRTDPPAR